MREAIRDIDRLRHIDECIEHINAALVWDTYINDLPLLKSEVTKYIHELKNKV